MDKEVVIIGGGHMGQKLYQHVQGRYNVVMLDVPNTTEKYTKLFDSWKKGSKFYIATPDETHIDWILRMPQYADLLIEKPLVYNLQQYQKIMEYVELSHLKIMCNLPWKLCREVQWKHGLNRVVWQRSKGWMYSSNWKRPCIGIDIGVHMFDVVGSIVGRDRDKFDIIVYNEQDVFEAYYKGIRIRLEYVIEGGKNVVQFRFDYEQLDLNSSILELDSVMPEEWILSMYDLWLEGKYITKKLVMGNMSDLLWLQKLLEEVRNGYDTNGS